MTRVIRPLDEAGAFEAALRRLEEGDIAAVPTETVYGLAADATRGEAVARIYEAKGRPSFNPLIAHVSALEMAERIARFDPLSLRLAEAFWPGPLTLVLPAAADSPVHPLVQAGLSTVALRMPVGPLRDLARALDRPIAAPSANRSGGVSATSAEEVRRSLGTRVGLVLDGGASSLGLESTILKVEHGEVQLLRPGALTLDRVETLTGRRIRPASEGIEAPGQMSSHYAPHGRVRLDAVHVEPGEHVILFGPAAMRGIEHSAAVVNLSERADLAEAAARLFDVLARFDRPEVEAIAVAPIPEQGLGIAINDRLRRASAPR